MNIEKELTKLQKEIYNVENKIEISQNKRISDNKSLYKKLEQLQKKELELTKELYK